MPVYHLFYVTVFYSFLVTADEVAMCICVLLPWLQYVYYIVVMVSEHM